MNFRYIGAKMMAVRALVNHGELISLMPANRFQFDGVADLLAIVPSQVDYLIESSDMVSRVRNVIIGGAPLDNDRRKRILDAGLNAYATYGMTETASHVALAHVGEDYYHALPGITFSSDNRDCLVIDMEGRDTSHIVTNDIVRIISQDTFKWIGRYDNVINSGGIKIVPEEIESVVRVVLEREGIAFSELIIVPRPSEKWGLEAVCLLETERDYCQDTLEYLRNAIKHSIDNPLKCPKEIICVRQLARTPSGKLDRNNSLR